MAGVLLATGRKPVLRQQSTARHPVLLIEASEGAGRPARRVRALTAFPLAVLPARLAS